MDDRINEVDTNCALQYVMYVLGQRHAELLACHRDLHKGVDGSKAPLAAAHYRLNNAAMTIVSKLLQDRGAQRVGFLDCFGGGDKFGRHEEPLPDHRLWSPEIADALHQFGVIAQAASSVGNRNPDVAKFVCDNLGVEYAGRPPLQR